MVTVATFSCNNCELGQDLGQANQIAEQSLKKFFFNGSLETLARQLRGFRSR